MFYERITNSNYHILSLNNTQFSIMKETPDFRKAVRTLYWCFKFTSYLESNAMLLK